MPPSASDPEPSREGQCLWLVFSQVQTDTGGNALPFAQPPRGQSSQLRVGSSARTLSVFYNKQSWDKTKRNPSKIILGGGVSSREYHLRAGCPGSCVTQPFSFIPWHRKVVLSVALLLCLHQGGTGVQEEEETHTFPSPSPYQDILLLGSQGAL